MDMFKDMQKFLEDGAQKMSDFMTQMTKGNPVMEKVTGFYKEMFEQSKSMVEKMFKNDFYDKMMKEVEGYKTQIMGKFTDLTKNFGDFSKIQKQFEDFVNDGNKKLLEMTNINFKDSFEKYTKEFMDNLKKFDFAKFFEAPKKAAPSATAAAKKA